MISVLFGLSGHHRYVLWSSTGAVIVSLSNILSSLNLVTEKVTWRLRRRLFRILVFYLNHQRNFGPDFPGGQTWTVTCWTWAVSATNGSLSKLLQRNSFFCSRSQLLEEKQTKLKHCFCSRHGKITKRWRGEKSRSTTADCYSSLWIVRSSPELQEPTFSPSSNPWRWSNKVRQQSLLLSAARPWTRGSMKALFLRKNMPMVFQ